MDVDDKETNKLGKSSSSENETDEEFQDLINQFCDGINQKHFRVIATKIIPNNAKSIKAYIYKPAQYLVCGSQSGDQIFEYSSAIK